MNITEEQPKTNTIIVNEANKTENNQPEPLYAGSGWLFSVLSSAIGENA